MEGKIYYSFLCHHCWIFNKNDLLNLKCFRVSSGGLSIIQKWLIYIFQFSIKGVRETASHIFSVNLMLQCFSHQNCWILNKKYRFNLLSLSFFPMVCRYFKWELSADIFNLNSGEDSNLDCPLLIFSFHIYNCAQDREN